MLAGVLCTLTGGPAPPSTPVGGGVRRRRMPHRPRRDAYRRGLFALVADWLRIKVNGD